MDRDITTDILTGKAGINYTPFMLFGYFKSVVCFDQYNYSVYSMNFHSHVGLSLEYWRTVCLRVLIGD